MYNVAIIGAGPAGIFSALEIVKLRPEWKVVLIEKGQKIESRSEEGSEPSTTITNWISCVRGLQTRSCNISQKFFVCLFRVKRQVQPSPCATRVRYDWTLSFFHFVFLFLFFC